VDSSTLQQLADNIKHWGVEFGFQKTGITDTNLVDAEKHLQSWLDKNFHGEMHYMQSHGKKRTRPELLVEQTVRIISCRMDYLPEENHSPGEILEDKSRAFISRYALGRDYHKLMRQRLKKLAEKINRFISEQAFSYRVFVDSAPVMEKAIAEKAGLGWIGKHTNLIDRNAGSWFFLGEIYTNLPLPVDSPGSAHCGDCSACIDICPTDAIIAPYQLDARRCISYLTIELKGSIPVEFRSAIGNRIYGCDDCQQVCPWNRFAQYTKEKDFLPRNNLDTATLLELFNWDEEQFLSKTEGSAIRRIGYERWLRNIAIALGNVTTDSDETSASDILSALAKKRRTTSSAMVQEHIDWAIANLA
jgi:epoxyqueuosine reductase